MAIKFRSVSHAGARKQQATLLVVALLLGGVLVYKYSASFGGTVVTRRTSPQDARRSLVNSVRAKGGKLNTGRRAKKGGAAKGGTAGPADEDDDVVRSTDEDGGADEAAEPEVEAAAIKQEETDLEALVQQEEQQEEEEAVAAAGTTDGAASAPRRISYPPIAEPDPKTVKEHCGATKGDWCGRYFAQEPIPAVPPPRGNHSCLWGCNFVGVCDAMKGWCRCPAGWTGDDCSTRMKRPCSQRHRSHGFEPYNEPTDIKFGGTTMACADLCDEDVAICYCNSTFAHGRVPADPSQPPGTPPQRIGRPIAHFCRRSKDDAGNPVEFGSVDTKLLYGDDGWCQADTPNWTCPCLVDGLGGPFCETMTEQYCPNQCNGHGECNLGFCKCHEGWFGQDCAYRMQGVEWSPGMEEKERPWIKPHVHTPAAKDPEPGATRKRPLIFVYELPPFYNAVMLQYRVAKDDCVQRLFDTGNNTIFNDHYLYNPEPGIHEMLLQSEHRTLDPEEADYFYLPVYASCLVFPVLGANDFPYFHGGPVALRSHAGANMFIEVYHWIRSHFPYWDRNGGRDHIVMAVHDEGSCWVPAVLRPAIVLSHWGRTEKNHISGTGYWPDNYTMDTHHPVWQPEGHTGKLGDFPCYDPSKDFIVPLMSSPGKYSQSPMLGAPTRERRILGFFKGRIQHGNPPYSRGTRQFLDNITRENDWWGKHKIHIGEGNPLGESGSYSEMLASSIFCFALMGDGYSSRFDDAVLHGCIPVIIQDGVELTWHSLLDIESYSVRIAQKDMTKIPEILQAVSKEDIARMQANLAKVWRRHIWSGYRPYTEAVKKMLADHKESTPKEPIKSQPEPLVDYDPTVDDAFSTLIQALYGRLDDLGAHAPAPNPAAAKPESKER